jgi:hypothetical protein
MRRGADLRKSASAPATARNLPKLWRVGLVPRPTYSLGNAHERPHTPRGSVSNHGVGCSRTIRREFSDFNAYRRPRRTTQWACDNATWTRLAKRGQNWPRMDTAGQIWTTVAKSGQPMDKIFPSLVGATNTIRSVKPKFFPCFCRVCAVLGLHKEMLSLADRGATRSKTVPG